MNRKAVGDQKVALVGNRARSEAELAIEATEYVSRGLAGLGGVVQGLRGFWHKTLPMWTGQVSLSPVAIIGLTLRVLFVVLAGVIPVFGRRAVSPQFAQSTLIDTLAGTYASLSPMDWLLASIGIAVYAVPKMLDRVGKRRLAGVHRPFTDLAAAIDKAVPGCTVCVGGSDRYSAGVGVARANHFVEARTQLETLPTPAFSWLFEPGQTKTPIAKSSCGRKEVSRGN